MGHEPFDPRRAADLEVRHHLEERTARLVEEGWEPDAAREEAARRFGDPDRYRKELAELDRSNAPGASVKTWIESVAQDLAYSLRALARQKTFAATFVGTLALGIGGAAGVYSVVDAVVLRPLPYDRPEEIVEVFTRLEGRGTSVPFVPSDQVDDWLAGADFFESTALVGRVDLVRADEGREPEALHLMAVTPELGDILGLRPRLGRGFAASDVTDAGGRVVLLSHAYWSRSGGDPDVVGSTLRLEDEAYTVVGVMPRLFKFPVAGDPDGWVPLSWSREAAGRPVDRVQPVGRLREDLDVTSAQERADALGAALTQERPTALGWDTELTPLDRWRANPSHRRALALLAGASALLLLVAVANAINLLLVRSRAREAEFGVRRAIGASRVRLARLIVTESVVLAVAAGGVAVGVATLAVQGVRAILPSDFGFFSAYPLGMESRAVTFTFALAFAVGLTVGLIPAVRGRAGRDGDLVAGGLDARSGRRVGALPDVVAVVQFALSVVLLSGSLLFLGSLLRVVRVEPGFAVDDAAFVELQFNENRYPTPAERRAALERMRDRLMRVPGVRAVALTAGTPPDGGALTFGDDFQGEGREKPEGFIMLPYMEVEEGAQDAIGMSLASGAWFHAGAHERREIVIDPDFARALFGTEAVVGRRVRLGDDSDWLTVVGVLDELKLGGLDDAMSPYAAVYPLDPDAGPRWAGFVVRTSVDPDGVLPALRAALAEVDRRQPLVTLTTGARAVTESLATPRFMTALVTGLAVLALALATLGVYGVVTYSFALRRRELGIRMALGASGARVRRLVFARGVRLALLGSLLGLALSLALGRVADSFLFGVDPTKPATMVGAAALMSLAALLATWIPAARAGRTDPVATLSAE